MSTPFIHAEPIGDDEGWVDFVEDCCEQRTSFWKQFFYSKEYKECLNFIYNDVLSWNRFQEIKSKNLYVGQPVSYLLSPIIGWKPGVIESLTCGGVVIKVEISGCFNCTRSRDPSEVIGQ